MTQVLITDTQTMNKNSSNIILLTLFNLYIKLKLIYIFEERAKKVRTEKHKTQLNKESPIKPIIFLTIINY